ncbi:MAG TPA: cation:proton antiporter, partial [Candidatus Mcinerneyibacterium sp.]|nr:cation:proton antiporter [Candidatus Mcinerneyibacterium sp.]
MELFYHILESIREGFSHHIIFSLGLLFISGFFLEQIVLKFKLPSITGYILAGIIIGDSVLGLIHPTNSQQLHLISEITLSLIAVIIGAEFSIKKLKKYGKNIIILTLFQLFF